MRLAAFNVENLFDRAKAFNDDTPGAHNAVLAAHAELNALFDKPVYSDADKARMLDLIAELGMLHPQQRGEFAMIRKLREPLLSFPRNAPPFVKARGREDWVGWCELTRAPVNAVAMENTARVINDLGADVLAVVEADSRPVLKKFYEVLALRLNFALRYPHVMLIDGNDDRGIDVGLMTGAGFPIGAVTSHIDLILPGATEPVFSRDCPDYVVTTPGGTRLHVLPNHFKSKFNDNPAKRRAQAEAARDIYNALRAGGEDHIAVLGDLNDTPQSGPLSALLQGTDLQEVTTHPAFTEFEFNAGNGQRGIGTHGLGNDDDKIDYILLSPALFAKVTRGGIFRKGAWPGTRPPRWAIYPELQRPVHAASDHHAIWVDIDL